MKLEVTAHIHLHGNDAELLKRFDRVDRFLSGLTLEVHKMTKLVDDIVAEVANIAAAVNALEAVITDLKSKLPDPSDQAKLEAALQGLKDAVADATDGVDEAAPPAP